MEMISFTYFEFFKVFNQIFLFFEKKQIFIIIKLYHY